MTTRRHIPGWRTLAILALCLAAPAHADPAGTASVVNPGNGHSYHVLDDYLTWPDAEAWATSLGGHLLVINDAAEDSWLHGHLGVGAGYYWIGANDAAVEGTFVWVTGEPFAYQNFLPGEPDDDVGFGGGGDYLALSAAGWNWLDTNGSFVGFVNGAIAEVPATSAVDPDASGAAAIRFEARPNVADGRMQLHFALPQAASVSCRVLDMRGRLVRRVAEGEFGAGTHELAWDARDDAARRVPGGSYLVQLRVDGASRVLKVAVMR